MNLSAYRNYKAQYVSSNENLLYIYSPFNILQASGPNVPSTVVVHPLVLLSVVDHFNRMGKIGNQKRVVGVLLGSWSTRTTLDISNSFAVPFDEDEKDREAW